ncbi:hypothetical protein CEXT_209981 [Caerostris extrusa]|uniref:Uncharacterized protein n=1 Tax=Caerostris extrusa TaxID=172846 RepID=A0AAV4RVP1_CAEEX|nr:hypothetical protein CEXT_209981 [Caerostris extrusa]
MKDISSGGVNGVINAIPLQFEMLPSSSLFSSSSGKRHLIKVSDTSSGKAAPHLEGDTSSGKRHLIWKETSHLVTHHLLSYTSSPRRTSSRKGHLLSMRQLLVRRHTHLLYTSSPRRHLIC